LNETHEVPGINILSAGYDINQMQGRKGKVFQFSNKSINTCPGAPQWTTPFGVEYWGEEKLILDIQVVKDKTTTNTCISGNADFKALTFAHLAVNGSHSSSTSSTSSRAIIYGIITIYRLKNVKPQESLNEEFVKDITKLSESYDYTQYHEIISRYGTHYISDLYMGGIKHQELELVENSQGVEDKIGIALKVDQGKVGGGLGGDWSNACNTENIKKKTQQHKIGGNTTLSDDKEWRESFWTHQPYEIPNQLIPLSNLFSEPQKSNFEKAVKKYQSEHIKSTDNDVIVEQAYGNLKGGSPWNDYEEFLPTGIKEIYAWVNDDGVTGIQITYLTGLNSVISKSKVHGRETKNMVIIPGNDITQVDMWVAKRNILIHCSVNGIRFHFKSGEHTQVGKIMGEMTSSKAPQGYVLAAFYGSSKLLLDSLGVVFKYITTG